MKKAIDFAKSRRVVDSAESSRAVSFKARVETRHTKTKEKIIKKESEIQKLTKLVVNGFDRMEKRFEGVDKRFIKNENDIETLARLVGNGFERLQTEMNERFDSVDKRFENIDKRFEMIDSQFFAINYTLKEHTERLDRIEKKQIGMFENTKEMVTKSEFKKLTYRVDILEKKVTKK